MGERERMNDDRTDSVLPDDSTAPEVGAPQSSPSERSFFLKEESGKFQSFEFIRQENAKIYLSTPVRSGAGPSDECNRLFQSSEFEDLSSIIPSPGAAPVAENEQIANVSEEHGNITGEGPNQIDDILHAQDLLAATLYQRIEDMKLIIQNYLQQKQIIPAENKYLGTSSLHVAAKGNFVEGIDLFLSRGAHIDKTDKNGFTPLHDAAMQKCTDAVEFLISKGADLKAIAGKSRTTALELVLRKTPKAKNAIKKRLDASIAINDRVENSSKVTLDFDLSPWESKNVTLLHVFSQYNVLDHPVIQVLIEENWTRVRVCFFIRLFFCIAFLVSLVAYCLLPNKYTGYIILFFACCDFVWEIGSFVTFTRSTDAGYFMKNLYQHVTSFANYISWFCYISAFVIWLGDDDYLKIKLAPLVCLASWFKLISYIDHLEYFSLYNSMYYNVMISFGKVSIAFSFYFLGFVFCFWNYFGSNKVEFENLAFAALKVIGMIAGEIDYGGLMASSNTVNTASNNTAESPEKHTMFLGIVVAELFPRVCVAIFVVSVPIVLMNLLTGIVVGDINEMRNAANSSQIKRRVDIIKHISAFISNLPFNCCERERPENVEREYDFEDSSMPDYLHTAYEIARSNKHVNQTNFHAETNAGMGRGPQGDIIEEAQPSSAAQSTISHKINVELTSRSPSGLGPTAPAPNLAETTV
ncbi:transient receptor potential channel pyrexia-like [Neocloeon triangulifer]|uniref:transient receptor potential channel pyrexia-like n=1 Tax=Neocloeon triangulifer TaxID=2078957 RepID=UPI00286F2ADD|nr:transient receptor potential channel pyrexia-like [Neocloeon triangulifer]